MLREHGQWYITPQTALARRNRISVYTWLSYRPKPGGASHSSILRRYQYFLGIFALPKLRGVGICSTPICHPCEIPNPPPQETRQRRFQQVQKQIHQLEDKALDTNTSKSIISSAQFSQMLCLLVGGGWLFPSASTFGIRPRHWFFSHLDFTLSP